MVKSDRLGWGSRPVGKRFALRVLFVTLLALASGVPPSFAMEWDCAQSAGDFRRSTDCTMGDQVRVSGDLSLTGQETVYSTLTAASDKRHFTITSGAYRVSLKWLNMTGGNVNAGYTASGNVESSRGGIFVYNVAADLIISHCVFFRNHAARVICDPSACPTGSYNQFLSTPLPPPLAMPCGETMPEFSCSKLPTRGVYQRSQDCTLEGEVHVSGDLSVSGQETVYSTLTAKSGARHFRIT
eukprot:g6157.t1